MNRSSIEDDASAWIARRDAGLTLSEQGEFDQWLSDPRHARAFARHEHAWQVFSRPHAAGKAQVMVQEIRRRIARRRRRRMFAIGATLSVLLITSFVWHSFAPRKSIELTVPASAHIVRQEQRTLPDGSVIELKAGAEISVNYSDDIRRVALLKGEAHFQVAKNKNRPFIVAVNNVDVRAVGTAFLVQHGESRVEVLVTEGVVTIDRRETILPIAEKTSSSGASIDQNAITLRVGDHAMLPFVENAFSPEIDKLDAAAIAERLAWRAPRLEFTGTPLREALALINQFNQVKITVADPSIAALEVSGYFRADNADTFLRLIEQSLGIREERKGNTVLLHKAR